MFWFYLSGAAILIGGEINVTDEQSASGVFPMAWHWVLQYLPDVVLHEQMDRAHFSPFAAAIYLSPSFGSIVDDLKQHPKHWTKAFLSNKGRIVIIVSAGGTETDFRLRA